MSLFLNQRDSVIFDINNDGSSELLALKKSPYVLEKFYTEFKVNPLSFLNL